MSGLNKKILALIIVLVLLPALTSCDSFSDETEVKYNYLTINTENPYGIKTIEPGFGRYRYQKGTIAEIELEIVDGYEFLGWQGGSGDDVAGSDGDYSIKIDDNKSVEAALQLLEFKPLEIDFHGIDSFEYSKLDEIIDVPHNLEEVQIKFNNALYPDNELEVRIEVDNDQEESIIETNNVEIIDNKIQISLTDWRDRFFLDDDQDDHLEFGEEYQLIVETPYEDFIIDIDNREYQNDEIILDFKVEEPYPETPENVRAEKDNNNYEISWQRSRANAQVAIDEYVEEYKLYRFIGESDFTEDEVDKIINLEVENPEERKVIRHNDNIDEEDDIYYRVKSVNDFNNKSSLSQPVKAN